jgi:chromosomal replication initiator protein
MEQLKDHAEADHTKPVSVAVIQQVVAQHFQITVDDLNAKRRTSELAFARHVAMYLCRELAKSSFPEIARKFGGRDHATVIHACRKISRCIKEDPRVSAVVSEIAQRLGAAL